MKRSVNLRYDRESGVTSVAVIETNENTSTNSTHEVKNKTYKIAENKISGFDTLITAIDTYLASL